MKAADLRRPLPGNEVEGTAVRVEIERLIQSIDSSHEHLLGIWTRPSAPGVFSDALHKFLCELSDEAARAAGLMRRLRVLCGDAQPERVKRLERQALGVSPFYARGLLPVLAAATEKELDQMTVAALEKGWQLRAERDSRSKDPDFCPECGGETAACTPDGGWSRESKKESPARLCEDCKAITPNTQNTQKAKTPPALTLVRE